MKEEHTAGAYGIEGRYPFLDKYVVQEFLWITSELKNSLYKAPIDNYLSSNNFPYEKIRKLDLDADLMVQQIIIKNTQNYQITKKKY